MLTHMRVGSDALQFLDSLSLASASARVISSLSYNDITTHCLKQVIVLIR